MDEPLARPCTRDPIPNDLGPYVPLKMLQKEGFRWQAKNLLIELMAAVAGTVAATMLAFLLGMSVALGWPISGPNFRFSFTTGAVLGVLGAVAVSIATLASREALRLKAAVVGAILWAVVAGALFTFWVAAVASV